MCCVGSSFSCWMVWAMSTVHPYGFRSVAIDQAVSSLSSMRRMWLFGIVVTWCVCVGRYLCYFYFVE